MNYNVPEPDCYLTLKGIITRNEKCNDKIVYNPVSNVKLEFILKNYELSPIVYKILKTDSKGNYIIEAPIFDFVNYDA